MDKNENFKIEKTLGNCKENIFYQWNYQNFKDYTQPHFQTRIYIYKLTYTMTILIHI